MFSHFYNVGVEKLNLKEENTQTLCSLMFNLPVAHVEKADLHNVILRDMSIKELLVHAWDKMDKNALGS